MGERMDLWATFEYSLETSCGKGPNIVITSFRLSGTAVFVAPAL